MRFEQLSKAFEDIHEIPLGVVAENHEVVFQSIHPEDKEGYIQAVANALATMQVFNHQWRIITPSGKIKWLEANSRPELRDNGEIVWHGVVQDISDRRQIELELRGKIEEIERFFSIALDLLCIADNAGYFRRLNRQWEKTLGYPLEQLEDSNFFDYVHPDDHQETVKALTQLEKEQQIVGFINRYRCQDGIHNERN